MTLQADLIQVVQRLSFCHSADAVLEVLREATRRLTGADGITVVLRDGDLCHYVEENAIAPLWKGRRFPMRACISGWAMLNRQQVVIEDIYADPRIPHDAYRPTFVRSLAMTPIRTEDPVGAIGAYWADHHRATEDELGVLQALGDSASTALANCRLIEALQDASRRKDQFLAMLAHELRNPLAPVRNALHILQLRPDDPQVVARVRGLMERQVGHMAQIVEDLLDMARLTNGKVTLERQRLDLARLVAQVAEDRRGVLEAAGLALVLDLPELPVWAQGDALRLTQVLGNLLDNACKFTPAGGQVSLALEADRAAGQVRVTVRDTGIGLEPELLGQVFDVFAQADRSLDRGRGGLGLGLSVARGLMALHEGGIEAASDGPGQGAAFTFSLPLEPEPAALADRGHLGQGAGGGLRVLVVEDNRDSAESLRLLLETVGYEVAVAYSGPDGVAAAERAPPDVVLCDIGLPGLDGYGVAGRLRGDPRTRRARLYAITGYGEEADRRRALEAGFDAHFVKPVDPARLLGQLAAAG